MGLYVVWLLAVLMLAAAIAGPPAMSFGHSPQTYSYTRHAARSHDYGRNYRDFYTLLRWVCCAAFAYSAFAAFQMKRMAWVWIFGVLAVLFNPIAPVYLQRATWQILDSASVAVTVTAAIVFSRRDQRLIS